MNEPCQNIYKFGRIYSKKHLERNDAAPLIGVHCRTLRNYECCNPRPANEVVAIMAEKYEFPAIVWMHCYELFPEYMPNIKVNDLKGAAMDMQDTTDDFKDIQRVMVKVTKDGVIAEDEIDDKEEIKKRAMRVAEAALTLYFSLDAPEAHHGS